MISGVEYDFTQPAEIIPQTIVQSPNCAYKNILVDYIDHNGFSVTNIVDNKLFLEILNEYTVLFG